MKILKSLLLFSILIFFGCGENQDINSINSPQISDQNNVSSLNKTDPIYVFPSTKSITIDGNEKDWARAPKHKLRKEIAFPNSSKNNKDLSSYFKMLWDEDNLYFFVSVRDQEVNSRVSGSDFDNDCIEIYIDGNNRKAVGTGGYIPGPTGDFVPEAYYNEADESLVDFFRFFPFESELKSPWNIFDNSNFESKIMLTKDGYNLEVRMPAGDIPYFEAQAGHLFGVEFQVNDHDTPSFVRDTFVKWFSDDDNSFQNPSLFGTAVLFKD